MSYHLLHSQKKRISLILPFFIILTMLNGCSQISFSTNEDKAFRKFTHDLFCREVSSNTISLHYTLRNPADYGISDCPVTYGSFPAIRMLLWLRLRTARHRFISFIPPLFLRRIG